MSKDIRSYFSSSSKSVSQKPKKKVINLIDSDDEDFIESTPEKTKLKLKPFKITDDESTKTKSDSKLNQKSKEKELKPVNIDDIFNTNPIKQTKVEPRPKKISIPDIQKPNKSRKKKTEKGIHGDDAFEKTLTELDDDDIFTDNLDILDKTIEEALGHDKNEDGRLKNKSSKPESLGKNSEKVTKRQRIPSESTEAKQGSSKENSPNKPKDETTKFAEKGVKRQRNPSEGTTPKKAKLEHSDSGIDPDQEAHEKRRYSAMLYQKYKNRSGPKMHGQKEIPKGNPDCLKNLTFLRTGVLDSMESEEFNDLVTEHGGKIVKAVSRKVNYLVVGEDAGPAKLEKSKRYGIPELNEDEFFDLILVKSGKNPKYAQKSSDSVESGIFIDDSPITIDDSVIVIDDSPKKSKIEKEQKPRDKDKKEKEPSKIDKNEEKPSKKENKEEIPNKKDKVEKHKIAEKRKHSRTKEEEKINDKPNLGKLKTESKFNKNHEKIPKLDFNGDQKEKPSKLNVAEKSHAEEESLHRNEEHHTQKEIPKVTEKVKKQTEIKKDLKTFHSESSKPADSSLAWTEKYKPTKIENIIGQQGDSSNLSKLRKWLKNWYRNQLPEVKKNIPRPSPWAKNDDGAFYKAALLSGPPGVGKTTTANLLSKELGFDIVEFNASDTRSKKSLQEEVSQILHNTTISGFAKGKQTTDKKRVLLMDEVDGMAGNEDRGGIQELINLIKNTSVPIICMCNDRNHQKMRSLVNYCFDLRFNKPRMEQIRGAMMSICFKEKLNLPLNVVTEIVNGTGCDIRQTLNHLTMYAALNKNNSLEEVQLKSKNSKKDTILGPWEVVRCVFSESEHSNMSLQDKSRLFFYDYSLGPLFVQENYLNVKPKGSLKDYMKQTAKAADAISRGDLIDARIRGSNNWSLLESQAFFSSVLPGHYMSGKVTGRINFPGWLGKNSSANKRKRLLSELHAHTRMTISGDAMAMRLDYLAPLRNVIITPLIKEGIEGINKSVTVMQEYNLLREDLNNLAELCHWKDTIDPFNKVDSKVKAAFTREYNKVTGKMPLAQGSGFIKKKVSRLDDTLYEDEEVNESDEEKDDVNTDNLIKIKSKNKADGASTSKKGGTSKSKSKEKDNSKSKGKAKPRK